MNDDATPTRVTDRVLGERLRTFQRLVGLPTVFAGATAETSAGRELRITRLRGTVGTSLAELRVRPGRGLGGSALASGSLRAVSDYASTAAITHDFDEIVVRQEQLTSIFALPIVSDGVVAAVLYGAVRGPHRIGDVVLDRAAAFGRSLEQELQPLLAPPPTRFPSGLVHTRAAIGELTELAADTADPRLRARIDRLLVDLREVADTVSPAAAGPRLAPRELDVLAQVALGLTNAEIAATLGLGVETVRAYLRSAMRRLEVGTRTAAVHRAREAGLL